MAMKTDKLDPQIVEYFLDKIKKPEDIFGDSGVMKELKKALTERILEGELTAELGYEKHASTGNNTGRHCCKNIPMTRICEYCRLLCGNAKHFIDYFILGTHVTLGSMS